jgi:cbb3-type cytochrome oxidase subunit 3
MLDPEFAATLGALIMIVTVVAGILFALWRHRD